MIGVGYGGSMFLATNGILARSGAAPAFVGLLDTYSGASAAYSLRRLSSTYTGNLIRVRRSSDNTEQDIGYNSSNVLDETALTSFVGAGNGFVTTWYDQSGNANNAVQTTAANQPQIVTSGVVNNINSKPSMSLDGTNDQFTLTSIINVSSSNYNSFVGKRDASSRRLFGLSSDAGAGQYLWALYNDNNYYLQAKSTQYQASLSTDSTTSQLLLTGLNDAGTMSMFKNGNTISSSATNFSITMKANTIGVYSFTGNNCHGHLQEIIFYNSSQSSNRTGIESNINTYYSIY
jgi:hypothetical protein